MIRRIRIGVIMGMLMATIYSAFVVILFMLRGDAPFQANEVTLAGIVGAYFASGVLGGAIVGLLSPLVSGQWSAMLVGIVAAFPVFVCLVMTEKGYFWQWGGDEWSAVCVVTFMFGTLGGAFVWSKRGGFNPFDEPTQKTRQ